MTAARNECLEKLWGGQDPFLEAGTFEDRVDYQGWASDNPLLKRAIDEIRPKIVVEIGVWKGGSVITMADRIRELDLDAVVIAIDTWLGAWDHWIQPVWFQHLRFESGFPTIFKTFAANICQKQLEEYVLPLPLDSTNASVVLKHYGISPHVLHIDGGHDFDAVMSDLRSWWPLLAPGGGY